MSKKRVRKKSTANTVSRTVAPIAATPATAAAPLANVTLGGVPEGTETEEWRVMSAKIAFAFWTNEKRTLQPSEVLRAGSTWEDAATEYRVLVRSTLRTAEREGIKFRPTEDVAGIEVQSEAWRTKTARFAWLLWLQNNRQTNRIPQDQELDVWQVESAGFRAYVRDAILDIQKSGCFLG